MGIAPTASCIDALLSRHSIVGCRNTHQNNQVKLRVGLTRFQVHLYIFVSGSDPTSPGVSALLSRLGVPHSAVCLRPRAANQTKATKLERLPAPLVNSNTANYNLAWSVAATEERQGFARPYNSGTAVDFPTFISFSLD